MEGKVSVIIPFYNPGTSFTMCLKSVCSQTYKNLEILLIDDGSESSSHHGVLVSFGSVIRIKLIRLEHE